MSSRVILNLVNNTNGDVTCTDISCETWNNLEVGQVVKSGSSISFNADTNDRLFLTWKNKEAGAVFYMAMTCPKSSTNSACGYDTLSGLQTYKKHGTPATFTFNLGEINNADWDNGDSNHNINVSYGSC